MTGRLYGLGLGPGDPELMTVKAVRLLREAPVVAWFAKAGGRGNARTIVDRWISASCEEMPLTYDITTEIHFTDPKYIAKLGDLYENSARAIAARLEAGSDVALLCEGDPLFYGSFMHVYVRLRERFDVTIVPGVAGMSGCWAAAGAPMTWGDDVLSVLPGTLDEDILVERLTTCDAAVVMKLGRNFAKARRAILRAGLFQRAIYVERGTMAEERVLPLRDKHDDAAPYFSIILIPGEGRRP